MSRPTGSAGAGGCAAPSRLRLHLGRAGGAAPAPPPGPPGALLNHGRPLLPPHLGETGWGRAGPAPGPAPAAPVLRNGEGERRCGRRPEARPCPPFTPAVKPPRLGGGAAGWGCRGEPGDSCCRRRRGESVSHRRELPGVITPSHTGRGSRARVPPGSGLPTPADDLRSAGVILSSLPWPGGPRLFPRHIAEGVSVPLSAS